MFGNAGRPRFPVFMFSVSLLHHLAIFLPFPMAGGEKARDFREQNGGEPLSVVAVIVTDFLTGSFQLPHLHPLSSAETDGWGN